MSATSRGQVRQAKCSTPGIEPVSRGFKNVKVGKGHMRLDYTKGAQPVR